MEACRITITTNADGVENQISRDGEMEFSIDGATLRYREENAFIFICLKGENAQIQREGDYSLRLNLKSGETCEGEIGIGGQNGGVETFTRKIKSSISKDTLLLLLDYDLIISGEKQEMKLRLISKFKGVQYES